MTLRIVSYGGGVQSTALLVLAAQGDIDFATFLYANVGDKAEPETLAYYRRYAVPYAAAHGLELVEIFKVLRDGTRESLTDKLDKGNLAIPARRRKDGPPMSRSCTADFKIRVIAKELQCRGATVDDPAIVALGISVDEIERATPGVDPRNPTQTRVYPLLDLGLHRIDCHRIIEGAGLPVPPKSACFFCPFHDREAWRTLKRHHPDQFADAVAIEANLSSKSADGRPVYLTRSGLPLDQAVDDQMTFDGMDGCDSGFCFT